MHMHLDRCTEIILALHNLEEQNEILNTSVGYKGYDKESLLHCIKANSILSTGTVCQQGILQDWKAAATISVAPQPITKRVAQFSRSQQTHGLGLP